MLLVILIYIWDPFIFWTYELNLDFVLSRICLCLKLVMSHFSVFVFSFDDIFCFVSIFTPNMQMLEGLLKLPENRECADCKAKYVSGLMWNSEWSYLDFMSVVNQAIWDANWFMKCGLSLYCAFSGFFILWFIMFTKISLIIYFAELQDGLV